MTREMIIEKRRLDNVNKDAFSQLQSRPKIELRFTRLVPPQVDTGNGYAYKVLMSREPEVDEESEIGEEEELLALAEGRVPGMGNTNQSGSSGDQSRALSKMMGSKTNNMSTINENTASTFNTGTEGSGMGTSGMGSSSQALVPSSGAATSSSALGRGRSSAILNSNFLKDPTMFFHGMSKEESEPREKWPPWGVVFTIDWEQRDEKDRAERDPSYTGLNVGVF
jgi:hypothetical protein